MGAACSCGGPAGGVAHPGGERRRRRNRNKINNNNDRNDDGSSGHEDDNDDTSDDGGEEFNNQRNNNNQHAADGAAKGGNGNNNKLFNKNNQQLAGAGGLVALPLHQWPAGTHANSTPPFFVPPRVSPFAVLEKIPAQQKVVGKILFAANSAQPPPPRMLTLREQHQQQPHGATNSSSSTTSKNNDSANAADASPIPFAIVSNSAAQQAPQQAQQAASNSNAQHQQNHQPAQLFTFPTTTLVVPPNPSAIIKSIGNSASWRSPTLSGRAYLSSALHSYCVGVARPDLTKLALSNNNSNKQHQQGGGNNNNSSNCRIMPGFVYRADVEGADDNAKQNNGIEGLHLRRRVFLYPAVITALGLRVRIDGKPISTAAVMQVGSSGGKHARTTALPNTCMTFAFPTPVSSLDAAVNAIAAATTAASFGGGVSNDTSGGGGAAYTLGSGLTPIRPLRRALLNSNDDDDDDHNNGKSLLNGSVAAAAAALSSSPLSLSSSSTSATAALDDELTSTLMSENSIPFTLEFELDPMTAATTTNCCVFNATNNSNNSSSAIHIVVPVLWRMQPGDAPSKVRVEWVCEYDSNVLTAVLPATESSGPIFGTYVVDSAAAENNNNKKLETSAVLASGMFRLTLS